MNIADIIVILAVAAILGLAFFILHHNKKTGHLPCGCDASSCSGNCMGCSQRDACGKKKS